MNGDEVRDTWFVDGEGSLGSGRFGYLATEVDELLRRAAAEFDAGRPAGPLIDTTTFRRGSGKQGYDVEAVDWFLDQLLLPQDRVEPGETSADPWCDVGDVAQLVLGGVSGLAQRYPRYQPTWGEAQAWFAGQCENAWRDFGQQPGVHLRWEQAGKGCRELRTAERTLVSLDVRGPISIPYADSIYREPKPYPFSVGGKRFTLWVGPTRSSSPVVAEILARNARDCAGHFAKPEGPPQSPAWRK